MELVHEGPAPSGPAVGRRRPGRRGADGVGVQGHAALAIDGGPQACRGAGGLGGAEPVVAAAVEDEHGRGGVVVGARRRQPAAHLAEAQDAGRSRGRRRRRVGVHREGGGVLEEEELAVELDLAEAVAQESEEEVSPAVPDRGRELIDSGLGLPRSWVCAERDLGAGRGGAGHYGLCARGARASAVRMGGGPASRGQ